MASLVIDRNGLNSMVEQMEDLVTSSRLSPNMAISLVGNLVDTDKEEAETPAEHIIFGFIEKMSTYS